MCIAQSADCGIVPSVERNTQTQKEKTMNYPLTPAQKTILAAAGKNVNFQGDDNDFGCLMSRIALKWFMDGEITKAWNCYQNDPGACYGVTFQAWESGMKTMVIRHMENERAMDAHEVAMQNVG